MAKFFPYMHLQNYFSDELNAEILAYAVKRQLDFRPSVIYVKGVQKRSDSRISLTLKDLGPYKKIMQESIRKVIPVLTEGLNITRFEVGEVDVEFAAYGDGAFFKSHIDTAVHRKTENPRVISAVYYLHNSPKKFEGGNLRFHALLIGKGDEKPKDILPDNNSLLAFPSFAPHEVLPVTAPEVDFKDWRFAVNCWIHKA
jgi:SM-20-related protein